jgi:hypothetical protein
MPAFPMPEGPSASFANPAPGVNTKTFALPDQAQVIVTFNPIDVNNPGTLILYDSGANAIVTMQAAGYAAFIVPAGGASYYFNASLGANQIAATIPANLR